MGSLQELQKTLRQKDVKISELERLLTHKDEQIQELKSQLDKYQSILPTSPTVTIGRPRKQRGVGISAEPASALKSIDLSSKTTKTHAKLARWVLPIYKLMSFVWQFCIKHTCCSGDHKPCRSHFNQWIACSDMIWLLYQYPYPISIQSKQLIKIRFILRNGMCVSTNTCKKLSVDTESGSCQLTYTRSPSSGLQWSSSDSANIQQLSTANFQFTTIWLMIWSLWSKATCT